MKFQLFNNLNTCNSVRCKYKAVNIHMIKNEGLKLWLYIKLYIMKVLIELILKRF